MVFFQKRFCPVYCICQEVNLVEAVGRSKRLHTSKFSFEDLYATILHFMFEEI